MQMCLNNLIYNMSFYNLINCEMYRIAAMHREAKKRLNATAYFYACAPDILFSCFSTVQFQLPYSVARYTRECQDTRTSRVSLNFFAEHHTIISLRTHFLDLPVVIIKTNMCANISFTLMSYNYHY